MKAIVFKLLCIALYVLLIQIGASYFVHYTTEEYDLSKPINFKLSLLKESPSPRIIVIGGSSTAFGIDYKRLSEITGYRVVNLGVTINIGLRYGMEALKPYLRNGDIVILSPEYENFFDKNIYYGSDTVAFLAAKNVKELSSYYLSSWQQLSSILEKLPNVAYKLFFIHDLLGKSTVQKLNFDEYGGLEIKDVSFSGKMFNEKTTIAPQSSFNDIVVKDLVQFQKYVIQKDAKVFVAYPFIPEGTYKINSAKIEDVHRRLQTAGLQILTPPSESFAAKIYFKDTIYHPNPIGRILRTDAIIHGLKKLQVLFVE